MEVKVIEPPERVERGKLRAGGAGYPGALLPIHPPEIDPAVLKRMVESLEIGSGKGRISDVKGHGRSTGGVDAEALRDVRIVRFVGMDAFRRVQIQTGLKPLLMYPTKESGGIREELGAPGIASPA
jgi:hypothetical protein